MFAFVQVITARHCDMVAFAFSLITNKCVTDTNSTEEANHEEVMCVAKTRQDTLALIVCQMVEKINADQK